LTGIALPVNRARPLKAQLLLSAPNYDVMFKFYKTTPLKLPKISFRVSIKQINIIFI